MTGRPTLHLTVGLPGVGKTTVARELEQATGALRLTPDEWQVALFGVQWKDHFRQRDVLEGRLVWVAHQVLQGGLSVILDFGCWSPDERYALRAIAALAGADFELHFVELAEDERRRRCTERRHTSPGDTFEMTDEDHDRFVVDFRPPTTNELQYGPLPQPPAPFGSWPAWASDRWPTLPRLDV